MALLILPVAALLAVAAPLVLTLFGRTYAAEGTVLLRWLCLSSPLVIFNAWYLAYLRVTGRIKRVVWLQVLAAAVLIALSYLLIHPLGVAGVGIAWLISQAAEAIFGLADARGVLLGHAPSDPGGPVLIDGAIFVSPHLDDAALSCGGGITRLVGAGIPVTVVSIFTADPPAEVSLSPLARYALATWVSSDRSFSSRRAEDRAAMGVLGARSEHLGELDVIFRRSKSGEPLYREPISAPAPDDVESLLPRLVAALQDSAVGTTPNATVFCPMAAYGHVDHTLAREAVEQVVDGARITYYDEYPYCARWGASNADATGPHGWQLHELPLAAVEIETRIAAIGCYESQLRGLFPSHSSGLGQSCCGAYRSSGECGSPNPIRRRSAQECRRKSSSIAQASVESGIAGRQSRRPPSLRLRNRRRAPTCHERLVALVDPNVVDVELRRKLSSATRGT